MVEAAAEAARGTDAGAPIAAAVVEALRGRASSCRPSAVIERAAIAGRARARRRATEAVLAAVTGRAGGELERLLEVDRRSG
jgi:hypothetical protein